MSHNPPAYAPRLPLPAVFLLGLALILAASLGVFYVWMRPSAGDMRLMVALLSTTAAVSAAAGYAAYRSGWIERSLSLGWTLVGGYALSGLLTFLNVWLTARLMFASQHDLRLATVLLVYATGIAVVLGGFLSRALAGRIGRLEQAARAIARGDLSARTPAVGRDELARLAQTFNEMALQLQQAQSQQQELDALRRDLVAWAGHDLQTPLASIQALVEALADGVVDDPQTAQRYLRTIQREIGGLSLLIDDLFQMAQMDAGGLALDRQENSLSDLLSDTLESFTELAARQGVRLQGSVAPGMDPVTMDARRVGRVLNNLIGNALRHTPSGGQVTVQAERRDGRVTVSVADTGEGIDPQDLPHVFDRFFRGEKSRSRQTGGAGLGLAIAQGIVQAHGGQIEVESQPGRGTTFRFSLAEAPDNRTTP